ncbi:MAG: DEAD/DEAH box helicase [Treponema sp.]|nr:DEAD/DEAH box helicase [Treponema sp.]
MKFTEFNLHPYLQKGIDDSGYVDCMPVQEQVLKNAMNGRDLYVQSQTGTGKTAAFLTVIFNRMLTDDSLFKRKALIMAPTRELAVQIEEEASMLGKYLPFKIGSFYGGVGYAQQEKLLRDNARILVGTPGRVLDLNKSGKMNLMEISFLVLDEADRMFDMGFYPDLRKLIKVVPSADRRQTMLFSATLNAWVKNLAWEYTKGFLTENSGIDPKDGQAPYEIEIKPETVTVEEITQILYHVPSGDKTTLLLGILKKEQPRSAIIFCNTKKQTEITAKRLRMNGIKCEFIIGDLPQVKRLKVINDLKAGNIKTLIATDVAARGLDIENLAMVINYDIPNEAENYVHRIGRTARAGKTGKAISLASEQDVYELPAIERYIGQKIPSEVAPDDYYAEDKSAGLYIKTDVFDEKNSNRNIPRKGADKKKENNQNNFTRRSAEDVKKIKEKVIREPRSGSAKKNNMIKSSPPSRSAENIPEKDLSAMSMEDRMAFYKKKYLQRNPQNAASEQPANLPAENKNTEITKDINQHDANEITPRAKQKKISLIEKLKNLFRKK